MSRKETMREQQFNEMLQRIRLEDETRELRFSIKYNELMRKMKATEPSFERMTKEVQLNEPNEKDVLYNASDLLQSFSKWNSKATV